MVNVLAVGLAIMGTGLAFWLFQKLVAEQRPKAEDLERHQRWQEEEDRRRQDQ